MEASFLLELLVGAWYTHHGSLDPTDPFPRVVGTGKTLLAKSIAAESGVRMFTCSGTDFFDVYTGVGARRIRETFEKMRNNAPAILFVDEFDALGAARGAQASGDESASIINELLVQMDGFEDNNGIVVLVRLIRMLRGHLISPPL